MRTAHHPPAHRGVQRPASSPHPGSAWALVVVAVSVLLGLPDRPVLALKPAKAYLSTPEEAKMAYEDVSIETPDGLALHGWFFPFQDQEGRAFHEQKPMVILVTDGNQNMGSLLWHYFTFLRGTPWHVLMFDWRGMGTSAHWDVDTTQAVVPEQLVDLRAAIDFAKARPEFDGKHLGLFGYGAGAAVVLAVAAGRDDIQAIAVRGVYTTQSEFCARRRAGKPPRPCNPHPGWPADLEPIRAAPKIKAPVFMVVGENDQVTPPAMAQAVHEALGGPKQYWVAPKAGHEGFECPEAVHERPFRVKLHGFFSQYLGSD